jgi:hypothetical protein
MLPRFTAGASLANRAPSYAEKSRRPQVMLAAAATIGTPSFIECSVQACQLKVSEEYDQCMAPCDPPVPPYLETWCHYFQPAVCGGQLHFNNIRCMTDPVFVCQEIGIAGSSCVDGSCCPIDRACGSVCCDYGTTCCDPASHECVNLTSDINNCGACGNRCQSNKICFEGTCQCPPNSVPNPDPIIDGCICLPVNCPAPQYQDPTYCNCVCPQVSCQPPKTQDPTTCECVCPSVSCPPPQEQDPATCECACPTPCPPPQEQDPATCVCACPPVSCEPPAFQDPATCECACPTASCGFGMAAVPPTCECACDPILCEEAGWECDPDTGECEPPYGG